MACIVGIAEDTGAEHSCAQVTPQAGRDNQHVDVRRGQALLSLAHRLWRYEAQEAGLVEAHESDEGSFACLCAHFNELSTEGCSTRASTPVRCGPACQALSASLLQFGPALLWAAAYGTECAVAAVVAPRSACVQGVCRSAACARYKIKTSTLAG